MSRSIHIDLDFDHDLRRMSRDATQTLASITDKVGEMDKPSTNKKKKQMSYGDEDDNASLEMRFGQSPMCRKMCLFVLAFG